MSIPAVKAIDEMADFFAKNAPQQVLDFSPSEAVNLRLEVLVLKEKTEGLSTEEKSELDVYMVLEQIMRTIKAKAKPKRA